MVRVFPSAAHAPGEGGIVIQLKNVPGYDVHQALEGRVPKLGGYGGNPKFGEQEIAVPGAISPENIVQVSFVTTDAETGKIKINWIAKKP